MTHAEWRALTARIAALEQAVRRYDADQREAARIILRIQHRWPRWAARFGARWLPWSVLRRLLGVAEGAK